MRCFLLAIACAIPWCGPSLACSASPLRVGFAEADITPSLKAGPVWLAGYGTGRKATGVHDPLLVRTIVLSDGQKKIAIASLDLVGLQLQDVRAIRKHVAAAGVRFDALTVCSTHNHEGPDVIGIWGQTYVTRGVNPAYLKKVRDQVVASVLAANAETREVRARFGTAREDALVRDSRLPIVKDGVLRVLRFDDRAGNVAGLVVQWNCHPEALGSRNTLVTADFPAATVQELKRRYRCPLVYLTGAVGGLMAPPRQGIADPAGDRLREGQFSYAQRYGVLVAQLAAEAIDKSRPLQATPLDAATVAVRSQVANPYYRTALSLGVLKRPVYAWTGDPQRPGPRLDLKTAGKPMALETEVACLKLGQLRIACIPGEIYPELVYGKIQTPADPNADFPDAPDETSVTQIFGSAPWMLLGLANDEIGYILPKRQWDQKPPYAYGRKKAQYGEINSCGPEIAPQIMKALATAAKRLP